VATPAFLDWRICFARSGPFPEGLTPDIPASAHASDPRAQASAAAAELDRLRQRWLKPHARLDRAVAEAYGWGEDWRAGRLDDDTILARLFALNQAR
jgi:hypothetical protein